MKSVKIILLYLILLFSVLLSGCTNLTNTTTATQRPIRLGVTAGPMTEIANIVAEEGKLQGLKIEVVSYNNFEQINKDLASGKLDANNFQSKAYMESYNKKNNTDFTYLNNTVIFRMGLYSKTIHNLANVPENGTVKIPKDDVNHARALTILEEAGLITLDKKAPGYATCANIISNPKHLKISSDASPNLPNDLDTTDLAVIPLSFLLHSNLDLEKIGLYLEPENVELANLGLVTRTSNSKDADFQKVIGLFRSEKVKNFIQEKYDAAILVP